MDTLKYVKNLEDLGLDTKYARGGVEIMADIINTNLATRENLKDTRVALKQDIKDLRTELKRDISDLRAELKQDITDLRFEFKQDIDDLRAELKQDTNDLRYDLTKEFKTETGELRNQITLVLVNMQKLNDRFDRLRLEMFVLVGSAMVAGSSLGFVLIDHLKK